MPWRGLSCGARTERPASAHASPDVAVEPALGVPVEADDLPRRRERRGLREQRTRYVHPRDDPLAEDEAVHPAGVVADVPHDVPAVVDALGIRETAVVGHLEAREHSAVQPEAAN